MPTKCTSCKDKTYLYLQKCEDKCISNYFANAKNNECNICDDNCQECEGTATICTACKENTFLDKFKCNKGCLSNFFANSLNRKCE